MGMYPLVNYWLYRNMDTYIYIVYHNYTIYVVYPLVNSQFANLKMAIEIVDLPIKNGDVPSFFVGLPEGMGMEQ